MAHNLFRRRENNWDIFAPDARSEGHHSTGTKQPARRADQREEDGPAAAGETAFHPALPLGAEGASQVCALQLHSVARSSPVGRMDDLFSGCKMNFSDCGKAQGLLTISQTIAVIPRARTNVLLWFCSVVSK